MVAKGKSRHRKTQSPAWGPAPAVSVSPLDEHLRRLAAAGDCDGAAEPLALCRRAARAPGSVLPSDWRDRCALCGFLGVGCGSDADGDFCLTFFVSLPPADHGPDGTDGGPDR